MLMHLETKARKPELPVLNIVEIIACYSITLKIIQK